MLQGKGQASAEACAPKRPGRQCLSPVRVPGSQLRGQYHAIVGCPFIEVAREVCRCLYSGSGGGLAHFILLPPAASVIGQWNLASQTLLVLALCGERLKGAAVSALLYSYELLEQAGLPVDVARAAISWQ